MIANLIFLHVPKGKKSLMNSAKSVLLHILSIVRLLLSFCHSCLLNGLPIRSLLNGVRCHCFLAHSVVVCRLLRCLWWLRIVTTTRYQMYAYNEQEHKNGVKLHCWERSSKCIWFKISTDTNVLLNLLFYSTNEGFEKWILVSLWSLGKSQTAFNNIHGTMCFDKNLIIAYFFHSISNFCHWALSIKKITQLISQSSYKCRAIWSLIKLRLNNQTRSVENILIWSQRFINYATLIKKTSLT